MKIYTNRQWFFVNFIFCILCLVIAIYFASLRFHFNHIFGGASPERLVNGNAYLPYQYRVLIPWFIKAATFFTSIQLKDICYSFETVSVFFLLVAYRYYLSLFISNGKLNILLSFTILYPLTYHYLLWHVYPVYYYPSDIPSVLFFTMGLIFMYKQNWYIYYIVFALAALNRETSCFLTFIYLFTSIGKSKWQRIGLHISMQLLIWIAIKYILYLLFSGNLATPNSVGSLFDDNIILNISRLSHGNAYVVLFSLSGFLLLPTLVWCRYIENDFIRRTLFVMIPFFVGMMIVGNIVEIRVFGETIPVILTAFFFIVKGIVGPVGKATHDEAGVN